MTSVTPDRPWALPDEPLPVRLMATIWADTDGIHDDFRTGGDVDAWLDAVGIERSGGCTTGSELASARALRDGVRRLAAQVTGDDRQAARSAITEVGAALQHLNDVVTHLPLPQLALVDGLLHESAAYDGSAVTAGLARIAREAIALLGGEDATRLRACHAPGCVLYFVKSHPRREWCSVACGNRARAARHYEKVRSAR